MSKANSLWSEHWSTFAGIINPNAGGGSNYVVYLTYTGPFLPGK